MTSGLRVGRLAGIDIYLDWSLAIIFFLIMAALGLGLLPTWHPDWGPATVWGTALAAAVLFFVSILVHEMSHALVGRAYGMTVPRITLFVFGGMAHLEDEPGDWKAEFWMAIAGPVTSILLGLLFAVLANLTVDPALIDPSAPRETLAALGPFATICMWLAPVNLVLGLFNLVPGFPLDGGRVLRAALWGLTGRMEAATRHATRMGQLVAWLLIGTGFAMILGVQVPFFGTGAVGGLWLALIGWFLNNAARGSYTQVLVRSRLADVAMRRLMSTHFTAVAPDITVAELIDRHLLHGDQRAFPVVEDGRLAGLITLTDVRRLPRERRADTRVRDVMMPTDRLVTVRADEPASEAAIRLSERGINQLPVVSAAGGIEGLVRREDVLKWLALYNDESFE
ncbi:peptidase M50 [Salinisphaera sp. PC39]|uniref:site-2 protease family protein n=1 Tax=Salinisphaera sp. PC39 TaxID=1304156 RepID=UPI0033401A8A